MNRPNPYEQGSIKKIADILLLPLIKAKPKLLDIRDWLEECFAIKTRSIHRYVAKKDFKLIGHFYQCPSKVSVGLGNRDIKMGMEVWVRVDSENSNRIDVEINRNKLGTQIFKLTKLQFLYIKRYLEEWPFRVRKRDRLVWLREQ